MVELLMLQLLTEVENIIQVPIRVLNTGYGVGAGAIVRPVVENAFIDAIVINSIGYVHFN